MLKILISTESGEGDFNVLEKTSADEFHAFHIRKPTWSTGQVERYIKLLPTEWQNIAVLHSHFELMNLYPLKGIHLSEYNRESMRNDEFSTKVISTSFHTINDLLEDSYTYEYVFLSPIFDSISKEGYKAKFSDKELIEVNKSTQHQIIALGGITEQLIDKCRSLGFKGIAILGSFW